MAKAVTSKWIGSGRRCWRNVCGGAQRAKARPVARHDELIPVAAEGAKHE